ncbi:hypothetical protein RhiirA4_546112 [Rhizophagus irregularis]|uniref:Uncharacterized protein n=1 Tax=Rhizophagus irregularis TaxID=588596 RepID=A0A2I1GVP2_9GLOM|nr:hypothetical protein RhiirA4_546112 [Rhizophagus irregularis]
MLIFMKIFYDYTFIYFLNNGTQEPRSEEGEERNHKCRKLLVGTPCRVTKPGGYIEVSDRRKSYDGEGPIFRKVSEACSLRVNRQDDSDFNYRISSHLSSNKFPILAEHNLKNFVQIFQIWNCTRKSWVIAIAQQDLALTKVGKTSPNYRCLQVSRDLILSMDHKINLVNSKQYKIANVLKLTW